MSALEIAILFFTIVNKIAVVGIAIWAVWALQTVLTNHKWIDAYPFLGKVPVRFAMALIAGGFAIDVFSVYVPGVSEVIMNFGIFIGMHLFRRQYKRNRRHHSILDSSKQNQKSEI